MPFREEDINEVIDRNDLMEVVSDYVKLQRAGRSYRGLCPFHNEKTPSFFVDPAKQLFHCFGCGEGGNVISFIMKVERLDFPEAVKLLAERVGYTLHYTKVDREVSLKEKLYQVHDEAAKFFESYLWDETKGKVARDYLFSRGFNRETLRLFRVGLAPSLDDKLTKYLLKKGFSSDLLIRAGLSVMGNRGLIDRFIERVIFPIFDLRGRIVAFGGRVLPYSKVEPKYLNSADSPIFHKSNLLYGLNLAKSEVVRRGFAIVVEGYTDVMALHQKGIKNAVATLGTAFTTDHLKTLSRLTDKVVLAFDSDSAGKTATERGLELLKEARVTVEVTLLPEGYDPADLAKEKGEAELQECFGQRIPLAKFCLDNRLKEADLSTAEGKARAVQKAIDILAALPSLVAQETYLKYLAEKMAVSEEFLRLEYSRQTGYRLKVKQQKRFAGNLSGVSAVPRFDFDPHYKAQEKRENEVLKLLLRRSEVRDFLIKELKPDFFYFPENREAFEVIRELIKQNSTLSAQFSRLNEKLEKKFSRLMIESIYDDIDTRDYAENLLKEIKNFFIREEIKRLKKELEVLDPERNSKEYDIIFQEIVQLERLHRNIS